MIIIKKFICELLFFYYNYLFMNFIGSLLAAVASYLIHYIPFIILETAWMFASLFGIWQNYNLAKRRKLISN